MSDAQEIKIHDPFTGGEYANAMQVVHTKEEFVMSFVNIVPPSGRVVGKVITSPAHLKRMIAALTTNLEMYEKNFGPVEPAENPRKGIGFDTV